MTGHLHLPHPHLPHVRLAEGFVAAFEHALHHGRGADPAPRAVPPADDWPEWHWDHEGGQW